MDACCPACQSTQVTPVTDWPRSRPLETLTQLSGAVKPGGHCFVSVPRLDTVAEHRDYKYCLDAKHHIVAYSEVCLRGLFVRAGLEPVATFHQLDAAFTKGRPIRLGMLARKME